MKLLTLTRMPEALRHRSFWTYVFRHGNAFRRTWFRVPFTSWGLCLQYKTREG